MKAAYLLENLQGLNYTFHGSGDENIFELCIISRHDTVLPKCTSFNETLFLADILDMPKINDSSACILFLPKSGLSQCYQKLVQILMRDYRRNAALIQLHDALSSVTPLPKLVELCHQVMQNPVWFLDRHFQVISYSVPGKRRILFPETLKRKADHLDGVPAIINANENFPTRHLLAPLLENGIPSGYILVFETNNTFSDTIDISYAVRVCTSLAAYTSAEFAAFHSSPIEQFILNILSEHLTSSAAISQQVKNLNFPESEKYYVLSIDQGNDYSSIYLKNELRTILNQDIYEFEHYYIALIGCKMPEILYADAYPELLSFLKEKSLFSGLSNAFFDLTGLKAAYEQSKKAIPLRKRYSDNTYFARYEDLILGHLLEIANENGMSVLSFCHPFVTRVYEYDKTHETEYLKTLAAYVFNFRNLQKTADVLYIHRNTAYHRINNLKEMFGIDFENPRLYFKLYTSVTIYNYLGALDTASLFGPFI